MRNSNEKNNRQKLFTISEFRRQVGIPLVLAKKLIVWGVVKGQRTVDGTLRIAGSEVLKAQEFVKSPYRKTILFIRALGPGLITGAADDDPGGIGTYSSVGARFGYAIIWMAPWLLPLMISVQEVCARIGIVTNKGLAGVLQEHYKRRVVAVIVILLIIANVANIGADIKAMADSFRLLIPVNFILIAVVITLIIIILEIAIPYRLYAKMLKWLTISLFAYVICGFIIHPDWLYVLTKTIIPSISLNKDYVFAMVAVFGTTISPYLFFWQTSEEVEEQKLPQGQARSMKYRIGHMRTDVNTGMLFANLAFFFIVLTTAQLLFKNGITNIESAEQAALALKPLAGNHAFLLFALGVIGTGLLAIPVLAGSGAYALSELINWREGLGNKFSQAYGFYSIIIVSILVGFGLNFLGIGAIKALYYSAFLNGVIAVPLLVVIMVIGNDKKIMGKEIHPRWVKFFGWLAAGSAFLAVCAFLILSFIK